MRTTLSQWSRLNSLAVVATILLIAGGILLVVGARAHDDTCKTVGGIVLGSGLTVVVGTLTGREAVHQQYAKEANLRRKTDSYGPLHEEFKALRETLDQMRAGDTPYPRRIATAALVTEMPLFGLPERDGPTLRTWSAFEGNYHADDFSAVARATFHRAQEAARDYNAAMDNAVQATVDVLGPRIETAINEVVVSPEYRRAHDEIVKQQAQPQAAGVFPPDRSWVAWLAGDLLRPGESSNAIAATMATSWATTWLTPVAEMPTAGWLLAGRSDLATTAVEATFRHPTVTSGPPPPGWVARIITQAATDMAADAAFERARAAFRRLHTDVLEGERALERGLCIIRDRYEGGELLV